MASQSASFASEYPTNVLVLSISDHCATSLEVEHGGGVANTFSFFHDLENIL
jgi:hypothetical protein